MHARKIGRVSEVLCARGRPIGIGHAIFSRPDNLFFEYKNGRVFRKEKSKINHNKINKILTHNAKVAII